MYSAGNDALSNQTYDGRVDDHSVSKSTSLMSLQSRQSTTERAAKRRRSLESVYSWKYMKESARGFMQSLCSSPLGCRVCLPLWQPARTPLSTIEQTVKQQDAIRELRNKSVIMFQKDNEEHLSELQSFAFSVFGEDFAKENLLKSKMWTTIGFQNVDPTTDLRAAGLFSLQNLFYLISIEPKIQKRVQQMERAPTEYYLPFAVACINITYSLLSLLMLNVPWSTNVSDDEKMVFLGFCNLLENEKFVFEEIYKATFHLLDEMWIDSRAKYFQFQEVLLHIKEKVAIALIKKPDNIAEFTRYLSLEEDDDVIHLV